MYKRQRDAQHHKGHHGDARGPGEVEQPGVVDAENAEKDAKQRGKQRQLQNEDDGPLQLFDGVHGNTVLMQKKDVNEGFIARL